MRSALKITYFLDLNLPGRADNEGQKSTGQPGLMLKV
jgi:hypothetical protein